ncbi:MAG: Holliday junction branch migration DNA helicase RuvB, partial [Planctomycetaceae bacterium]|nr:Holliday junction branch migration DNA helicase RuvB [Planctomycetaceae bacterium]
MRQPVIGSDQVAKANDKTSPSDVDKSLSQKSDKLDSGVGGGLSDITFEEDRLLRPQRMQEMIGQREVFSRLQISIVAAQKRKEPLGHILFDGPPGLGKTTFATCIPHELGVSMQIGNGATLKSPKDIVPYLTNAEGGSVLFIDEIHRMHKSVEEFLYPAMEDFRIDLTLGEGVNARTLNITLKPFTLIGATTRTGLISAPLRDRFQMREHLDFYTADELALIIKRNAVKLQIPISDDAAHEIAIRSRGTPRLANNRLRWVRDFADAKANGKITMSVAMDALQMQGIDHLGLDMQDRKFLETILRVFGGGPVGIESVAHTMNTTTDTLVDEVEPFMLRSELVFRSPRGRCLTEKGYKHLGVKMENYQNTTLFANSQSDVNT